MRDTSIHRNLDIVIIAFKYPISYYSLVDSVPVLLYSELEGYVDPISYSPGFLNMLDKLLVNGIIRKPNPAAPGRDI